MGIIERIRNVLNKKSPPRRFVFVEGSGSYIPEWRGTYEDFKKGINEKEYYIDHKLLMDYYRKNEWVRACVDALVNEVMSQGWEFYVEDETESYKRLLKKLDEWFKQPNAQESSEELLRTILVDWLVTGDAFIELVPSDLGNITELYAIDPQHMKIKIDKHGIVVQYIQKVHGKDPVEFDPEDIIHWKYQSVSSSVFGLSPLETLLQTAAGDLNARDYNNNFFKNAASPRLHVDLGEGIAQDEIDKFMAYWDKELKGKPFKNIFTGGGATVKEITYKNIDMQYIDFQKMNAQKILAVYGVPPIQIGLIEGSNRFNADEQRQIWKESRVHPLQRRFANGFNEILNRMGIKHIRFRFIGLDKPDPMKDLQMQVLKLKHGLRTINELRIEDGLEPVEWGDKPLLLQTKGSPGSGGQEGLEVNQEPDKARDTQDTEDDMD